MTTSAITAREPDLAAFRAAFGKVPTAVSIVAVPYRDTVLGITVSSVSSLSADPPLLMFNVDSRARSNELICDAGRFGVNVLGQHQSMISDYCARRGSTKEIAELCLDPSITSTPVLAGVAVHMDCTLEAVHPGGDHNIFVGRIHRIVVREDVDPLVHLAGRYRRMEQLPSPQPPLSDLMLDVSVGATHDWTAW